MTLEIEITPELQKRLQEEASHSGVTAADYARTILEKQLLSHGCNGEISIPIASSQQRPLAAALKLAEVLDSVIKSGTHGPLNAVLDIEVNRQERMDELDARR